VRSGGIDLVYQMGLVLIRRCLAASLVQNQLSVTGQESCAQKSGRLRKTKISLTTANGLKYAHYDNQPCIIYKKSQGGSIGQGYFSA
jgi:hypothetical protein